MRGLVLGPRLGLLVLGREVVGPEEELVRGPVVDELLAVEQDEVDADLRLQVLHVVAEFHQEGDGRRPVVGADERLASSPGRSSPGRRSAGCRSARTRSPGSCSPGATRRSCWPSGRPCAWLGCLPSNFWNVDLGPELLEVLLEEFLLLRHPLRAADPRADVAEGGQVGDGPVAVERPGLAGRRGRPSSVRGAWRRGGGTRGRRPRGPGPRRSRQARSVGFMIRPRGEGTPFAV